MTFVLPLTVSETGDFNYRLASGSSGNTAPEYPF
jgi:hypothetical protein